MSVDVCLAMHIQAPRVGMETGLLTPSDVRKPKISAKGSATIQYDPKTTHTALAWRPEPRIMPDRVHCEKTIIAELMTTPAMRVGALDM